MGGVRWIVYPPRLYLGMSSTPLSLYVAIIFSFLILVAEAASLATHKPDQPQHKKRVLIIAIVVPVLVFVIILISAVFIYSRWVKRRRSSRSLSKRTQGSIGSDSSQLPEKLKSRTNEDSGNSVNLQSKNDDVFAAVSEKPVAIVNELSSPITGETKGTPRPQPRLLVSADTATEPIEEVNSCSQGETLRDMVVNEPCNLENLIIRPGASEPASITPAPNLAQSTHSQTPEFENTQNIGTDVYTTIADADADDGDLSIRHVPVGVAPMVFHSTGHVVGHVPVEPGKISDRAEEVLVERHVVEEVQESLPYAVMEAHESMLDVLQEPGPILYSNLTSPPMAAKCVYESLSDIKPPQLCQGSLQEYAMPVAYTVSPTIDADDEHELLGPAQITPPHSQSFVEDVRCVESTYDDFNMGPEAEVSSVVEVEEQSIYADRGCIGVSDEVAPSVVRAVCPKPPSIYLHSLKWESEEIGPSLRHETVVLQAPQTAQEFQENLDIYVEDTGLQKFFPPSDIFLRTVARKAAALRHDPTTNLGSAPNIRRLARLSLYHLIIYCDDSGSMAGQCYAIQSQIVSRIAKVATRIVPDHVGVDLQFLNSGGYQNIRAEQVPYIVSTIQLTGATPIGTHLRENILVPQVYAPLAQPNSRIDRPLLICIITDGCPNCEDPSTLKNAVVECRRRIQAAGYQSTAVRFSVSQIGNDYAAGLFLDELRRDPEIQDVVRCTTDRLDEKYEELRWNERNLETWLLEMLTNPIMERGNF